MPTMIYHAPFPLRRDAATASQIRPVKMREAFESIGYKVIEISGYAKERSKKIKFLTRKLRNGLKVDFVYSEAASIPTSFTESRHFPLHLFMDRGFFRTLHKLDIPIGVFYRDVYWVFPDYVESVGRPIAAIMRKLYEWDINTYNRYVTVLFLPSLKMAPFVPGLQGPKTVALPPGAPASGPLNKKASTVPLRLLYVGNVGGSHYRVSNLFEAVKDDPDVSLTVITRENDWHNAKEQYGHMIGDNVTIIHEVPDQLEKHYQRADIALLFIEPQEYRDFAVPFKLFEYLGYGKPVIASARTFAGEIVEKYDAGWTIPYTTDALKDLLSDLVYSPRQVSEAAKNARHLGIEQSWENRAREVAAALTGV